MPQIYINREDFNFDELKIDFETIKKHLKKQTYGPFNFIDDKYLRPIRYAAADMLMNKVFRKNLSTFFKLDGITTVKITKQGRDIVDVFNCFLNEYNQERINELSSEHIVSKYIFEETYKEEIIEALTPKTNYTTVAKIFKKCDIDYVKCEGSTALKNNYMAKVIYCIYIRPTKYGVLIYKNKLNKYYAYILDGTLAKNCSINAAITKIEELEKPVIISEKDEVGLKEAKMLALAEEI